MFVGSYRKQEETTGFVPSVSHGGLPDGGDQADTEADTTLAGRLLRKLEPHDAFFAENDRKSASTRQE